jgi:hypothetical protein
MIGTLYRFALTAQHHKRRRAVGMDEVALFFCQHGHELLVVRHHGVKLVLSAPPDVEEQRNEANAFRQQPADLLGYARPHGRVDHADHAAPTGKRHEEALRLESIAASERRS